MLLIASASALAGARGLQEGLEKAGVRTDILTGVPAEPSVADFEAVLCKAEAFPRAEAVIGLGGGSVLDVAKLVAALLGTGESVRRFFGNGLLTSRALCLIAIPTTAGAGSEASPNAILYDEVEGLKKAVISPLLVPDIVFIDASLALTVPAAVTAATGLDALTHCIEAHANKNAHPFVSRIALDGIRLIGPNLVRAVQNGADLPARAALALGSYQGGLCLGPVNTAAVHALSYPLGSRFRLAHGLSNAMLLPDVVRFNLGACPSAYAEIGDALGLDSSGSEESRAEACATHLARLAKDCGLPENLGCLGVREEDLPEMAADALKIQRLLINNPREVSLDDAICIYRKAL